MSIRAAVKRVMDKINESTQTGSKYTFEEQRYENGELFIKKIVKHGEEADKEIVKHMAEFKEKFSDFMKEFND